MLRPAADRHYATNGASPQPVVALRLELMRQIGPADLTIRPSGEDVHDVGRDEVEQALMVFVTITNERSSARSC